MREIKYYVAWDDSEFESVDECMAYEERAISCAQEFNEAYSFYDKDMNKILAPSESVDVEEWMDWLACAIDDAAYIRRYANLTEEAEKFYCHMWGTCVLNDDFDNELGLFNYDFGNDTWVKVGE